LIDINKETLTIGWCDNGTTDGKFTEGLVFTLVSAQANNIPVTSTIRISGNQIARQRQNLFDRWADEVKTDWLLWIDSDIVLTYESLLKILHTADKDTRKIVSGVYFISTEPETGLMKPLPCVYNLSENKEEIQHIDLPTDKIIEADCAGFGFVLMHKSIIDPLRQINKNNFLFAELTSKKNFIGEDIAFFVNVKNAGIQLYVHTGILLDHIKRFNFNAEYHNFYWNNKNTLPNK
jgi:hypothetical protein